MIIHCLPPSSVGPMPLTLAPHLGPFLPPRRIPVRRAAMSPTLAPGGHSREVVVGWPTCWRLPPPCGCSTGFIAHPRTFGQQLRFTLYLWKLVPAFNMGLSKRPPPDTMPMTPRQVDGIDFLCPDGKRMRLFFPSSECPTIMQEVPPARAKRPRSNAFSSHMEITVPSGIFASGSTFPTAS